MTRTNSFVDIVAIVFVGVVNVAGVARMRIARSMTHHSCRNPNRRLLTRLHILLNVLFSNGLLAKQSLNDLSLYTTSPVLLLHCTRSFNDVGNDTSGSPPLHPSTPPQRIKMLQLIIGREHSWLGDNTRTERPSVTKLTVATVMRRSVTRSPSSLGTALLGEASGSFYPASEYMSCNVRSTTHVNSL